MRITFLSPRSNLSGGLRVIAVYAEMLHARGHEVTIVTPSRPCIGLRQKLAALAHGRAPNPPEPPGHFEGLSVPVVEAERSDFQFGAGDVPDADAIVATWWETAFAAAAMPPEKGRGFYFVQGHEVFDFLPWQISRATYFLPLRQIAVSRWLSQTLAETYGLPAPAVVPNAIDHARFSTPARDRNARPVAGFVYCQGALKGAGEAIAALHRLRVLYPELGIIVFGAEPLKTGHALPEGAEFHLRPAQAEIPALYARCDLWLCPSHSEGFGLPMLEAMAARCPVVGTRVGAAFDLIEPGVTGQLCEVGDMSGLVQGARAILDLPPADWRTMSDACHARASEFTWEHSCDRFEALLAGDAG
ncbi:glycosyltransferase family 4 protein [Ruegeria marina]|uniref:Glycosyltransferase involved in cell wall bisynthesis n=1 Tax=Ruegeria marina TaxID=639004 RepID=A0A1G6T679_9RHOB|nr:glycosyltransferase family 4 protein [Ruegeria marina]SDD24662.1 Glycosyltransferase involved in cell wall bisynthesis [Ruegeria marina]